MALLLLELNEVNFRIVSRYLASGVQLPGFAAIFEQGVHETIAENKYDLLEPWIQWPSVHTGKSYDEHKVFRLGDIVKFGGSQIFEVVEQMGFSVGAISPMNADNRLQRPAYFIPDPWTSSESDPSVVSRLLTRALRQAVNDNSQGRITTGTILSLGALFVICVRKSRWLEFFKYVVSALDKPWRRALFLDMYLNEVHLWMLERKRPDFSTLFLNAGAHIQHHYFLNSRHVVVDSVKNPEWYLSSGEDPLLEMLFVYDRILSDYMEKNLDVIVATGLSQTPFHEPVYYYRLKDHSAFLNAVGVPHQKVYPRMTRDFLISFADEQSAASARDRLGSFRVGDDTPLFGGLDLRGAELFVTLTYPYEVKRDTLLNYSEGSMRLKEWLVFVAIKNGEHDTTGYCFFSSGVSSAKMASGNHVSNLFFIVKEYFARKLERRSSDIPSIS